MLDSIAHGFGLLLLVAGTTAWAGAEGVAQVLRIDLSDPDPVEIEELPGILDEEAASLRNVAGPGPGDLGDRLARTGISIDRLRDWAPYLDAPASGPGGSQLSARSTAEMRGSSAIRGRVDLRLEHAILRGDLVSRFSAPYTRRGDTAGASLDGRLGARLASRFLLWGGALAGGLSGIDPWDDPLRSGSVSSSSLPRAGFSARSSARGVYCEGPRFAVSGWRDRGARRSGLIALRDAAGAAWLGLQEGTGCGAGGAIRLRRAVLAAAIHSMKKRPSVLRIVAADAEERARLTTSWSLRERSDGRSGLLEGSFARTVRSCRLSMRTALLSNARFDSRKGRGEVGFSSRRGATGIVGEAAWAGRQRRFRVEWDRAFSSILTLRLRTRGSIAGDTREGLIDLAASSVRGPSRFEGGFMMRTAGTVQWPSYPGADRRARIALHAKGSLRSGLARIDLVFVAPVSVGPRAGFAAPYFRIGIEQGGLVAQR